MSSTRHAKPETPLRQERFLSAPEFEHGLKAYPVARRCELLTDRKERELAWWLQSRSQQEGGLQAIAEALMRENPNALATPSMRKFGKNASQIYNAKQVKQIRSEICPHPDQSCHQPNEEDVHSRFPLRGEFPVFGVEALLDSPQRDDLDQSILAVTRPSTYPAKAFLDFCRDGASRRLPGHLRNCCLDPAARISDDAPWYFAGLRSALLALMEAQAGELQSRIVVTAIGATVHRCLNRALKTRRLVVVNGVARIGKSYAAETWCRQNPGLARFVEVPASNDDISFFRAIARGLGLGNFLNYKTTEIRERVEAVLSTGQILLVLDEAHRLWPQTNPRSGHPSRINWLMSMTNRKIPICALTTPQFFDHLQRTEATTSWNSAQLTGRILSHEQLPSELSKEDLDAVARNLLPEAGDEVIAAIVAYARSSEKYLAAIDSIATLARFQADEDGREEVRRSDIQRAMRDSVIPSDRSLAKVMERKARPHRNRMLMPLETPVQEPEMAEDEPRTPAEASGNGGREIAPLRGRQISAARHGRAVRPVGDPAVV
jgi:hypothetical protein